MQLTKLVLSILSLATLCAGCTLPSMGSKTDSTASSMVKEVEARDTLNAIMFDQQTYYITNQAFTTSLKHLDTMKTSLESPTYKYSIQVKPDKQKGVWITATPRHPNLRSFTGVVFALKVGNERLTVTEICETTTPSKQAPAPPTIPKTAREAIQCPAGSMPSMKVLAMQ